MKKLLTILFLFIGIVLKAQSPIYDNVRIYGYLVTDDSVTTPKLIVDSIEFANGDVIYSSKVDTAIFAYNAAAGDSVFVTVTADTGKINVLYNTGMLEIYNNGLYAISTDDVEFYAIDGSNTVGDISTAIGIPTKAFLVQTLSNQNEFVFNEDVLAIVRNSDTLLKVDAYGLSINEGDVVPSSDTGNLKTTVEGIGFDSLNIKGYSIRFNESEGVHEFKTAKSGVVWQGPLEDLIAFYNNTGATIPNCTPVSFLGTITGDSIPNCYPTCASNELLAEGYVGITTTEIPNNDWGYVTSRGYVRGCPTSQYDTNEIWVGDGVLIDSTPPPPSKRVLAGIVIKSDPTDGIIYSYPTLAFFRQQTIKDYNFSSGTANGIFYRGGFYRAPASSVTLTQASLTQTYGTANVPYSAHPFIVLGGAGTATGGVIGLRVTGTSVDDLGNYTTSDADTILTDITSVALNEYYEAKKFVGTVTYQLITISGTPTTYSLSFNYGYAKYDDANNSDFYIIGSECVGVAGANDTGFDIELLKHSNQGWTYSASAFVPGGTSLAKLSTDITTENNLATGIPFAWKRSSLNQFIEGSSNEGILYKITTTANSAVQSMDLHAIIELE